MAKTVLIRHQLDVSRAAERVQGANVLRGERRASFPDTGMIAVRKHMLCVQLQLVVLEV